MTNYCGGSKWPSGCGKANAGSTQEMMNFWKQTTHVMSYFKEENFRTDKRLPSSFMTGFLEVCPVRI
jgi:hypothetical protein